MKKGKKKATGKPPKPAGPSQEASLEQGTALREQGRGDDALAALRRALQGHDAAVAAAARYEIALVLSQQGKHAEADKHLSALGFRLKLSSAIMDYSDTSCAVLKQQAEPEREVNAIALDNAVPPALFAALQEAFSPDRCVGERHH